MISCEEVLREMSSFIDDDVALELRRQIEEHLRACRNCTVLVNTTRKTLTLVADHYSVALPHGVSARLLQRLGLSEPRLS